MSQPERITWCNVSGCRIEYPHGARGHFDDCRAAYNRCLQMTGNKVASINPSASCEYEMRPKKLSLMSEYIADFENAGRWTLPLDVDLIRAHRNGNPNPNAERPRHRRFFELHVVQGVAYKDVIKLMNVSESASGWLWREIQDWVGAELERVGVLCPPWRYFTEPTGKQLPPAPRIAL